MAPKVRLWSHKGMAIFLYNQELPAQESMVTLPIEKMMHQPQDQEPLLACKPHKGRGAWCALLTDTSHIWIGMIVWHVRGAQWIFFSMNWVSELLILLLKNHAMPKINYSSQWISWSLFFNMHQVDKTNIEKRIQMPSWCCLSLEIIDISEAWPLPHFGFQSQAIALDWQNLATSRTYHRRSLENMVFCFFSLFNTRQHYKRGEQSIPLHLNIHVYTSYYM